MQSHHLFTPFCVCDDLLCRRSSWSGVAVQTSFTSNSLDRRLAVLAAPEGYPKSSAVPEEPEQGSRQSGFQQGFWPNSLCL
jgi:hypothetical protein